MSPWRRSAAALVLALAALAWTVAAMLPQAVPDPAALALLLAATWGAGLLCAGLAARPGAVGALLSVVAAGATLLLGAALFGLMLSPPAGAAIAAQATLRLLPDRPLAALLLVAGGLAARALSRR